MTTRVSEEEKQTDQSVPGSEATGSALGNWEAEERFQLLVNSVQDYGIFLLDPLGFIQTWNEGAFRIKGYAADEVIGKHFSRFYTPEDIERKHPQWELERAVAIGRYEEEGWRLRKNGTKFWANVVITALRDKAGQLVGFAKVTRDLTERKEAEEKLRLSEERARKMFENVKDYAMIMLEPNGTVASWNEGARRITGYEPIEIIGRHFSTFYPEQDVQMGKCEYELVETAETGRFEDEGWRVRKDGTKFWASVLITAIRGESGSLIGYSKVTRDITDRKRADDLRRMAYTNLEKRVQERTQELTRLNEQLQDAVRVRDEFLSIASHELRTPLTPLKLQIQGLTLAARKGTLTTMSEQRLERVANTCDRALSRLASLIDNLLDVSRINTGKLSLNLERVNLVEMARELIERFAPEISSSGSTVTLHAPEKVVGSFDRLRMEQVFLNLLTNSLKYGARRPIEVEVGAEGDTGVLRIRDQGIGIAAKDQEKIFERFERVVTETGASGLGLGLYITRQIVHAHGGLISVESASGNGSVFTVKVPLFNALS